MTINEEILIAANKIANAGKKPTVALIKAKLAKPAPLPVIISLLKSWQHDPEFIAPQQEHQPSALEVSNEHHDNVEIRQMLNQELAAMKQEIAELKQLIKQLLKQQSSQE